MKDSGYGSRYWCRHCYNAHDELDGKKKVSSTSPMLKKQKMILQDVAVLSDDEEQDGVMSTTPNLINEKDTSDDSIIPYAFGETPRVHDLTPLENSFVNEMLYARRTGNELITTYGKE